MCCHIPTESCKTATFVAGVRLPIPLGISAASTEYSIFVIPIQQTIGKCGPHVWCQAVQLRPIPGIAVMLNVPGCSKGLLFVIPVKSWCAACKLLIPEVISSLQETNLRTFLLKVWQWCCGCQKVNTA
jgi:hypothetical protein